MKDKKNPIALFFLAILNAAIIICAVPIFVGISLPESTRSSILIIDGYFLLEAIIFYLAAKVRHWWGLFGFIGCVILEFVALFLLFPSPRGNWFDFFFSKLGSEIESVLHFNFVVMPNTVATVLILFFVTIILWAGIYCYQWYVSFPLALTYILSITVFDNHDHLVAAVLILLFFSIQLFLYTNYDQLFSQSKYSLSLIFIAILVLGISIGGGILVRKNFIYLTKIVDGPGVRVRNKLNTMGFYQSINEQTGNNSDSKRAGFSINSRELGGSILDNNNLVYTVWESQPNYLRLDTKRNYSGRGFDDRETLGENVSNLSFGIDELNLPRIGNSNTIKIIYSPISKNTRNEFVPQVYGKMSFDLKANKIKTATQNFDHSLLQYDNILAQTKQFSYEVNYYDLQLKYLQKITKDSVPADIKSVYTQLPAKLPKRVKDLASTLITDKQSQLDQVLAIQNYLSTNAKFTYSRTDAKTTPKGRDFVDYFLFDHPVGYCDNFATSMLVLLRSVGIPVRYAEGFSQGTYRQKIGEIYQYEIRNNNAHSWPEVYFNSVGWVPFEPTPGFNRGQKGLSSPKKPDEISTSGLSRKDSGSSSTKTSKKPSKSSTKTSSSKSSKHTKHKRAKKQEKPSIILPIILSFLTLLIVIVVFIFRKSIEWIIIGFIFDHVDNKQFYLLILRYFESRLRREKGEPLTHYAKRVGILYPQIQELFEKSSKEYEKIIYGNESGMKVLAEQLQMIVKIMIKNPNTFHENSQ